MNQQLRALPSCPSVSFYCQKKVFKNHIKIKTVNISINMTVPTSTGVKLVPSAVMGSGSVQWPPMDHSTEVEGSP